MRSQAIDWLQDNDFGSVVGETSLTGGSISTVERLHLDSDATVVLKTHTAPPNGLFQAEAEGLRALSAAEALAIPAVLHWQEGFLLLQDLGQGSTGAGYWEQLGTGLARLHAREQPCFGFHHDTFCGPTRQINTQTDDGHEFFAHCRLLPLTRQTFDRSLLSRTDVRNLEYIANNLKRWIPEQPPVLIHGDLWSGNVHSNSQGNPALIDPAVHWGWAEADLAMTSLFGGFDQAFYDSYREASNLEPEWEQRLDIYNLYHLLNHLLLFGAGYRGAIRRTCACLGPE